MGLSAVRWWPVSCCRIKRRVRQRATRRPARLSEALLAITSVSVGHTPTLFASLVTCAQYRRGRADKSRSPGGQAIPPPSSVLRQGHDRVRRPSVRVPRRLWPARPILGVFLEPTAPDRPSGTCRLPYFAGPQGRAPAYARRRAGGDAPGCPVDPRPPRARRRHHVTDSGPETYPAEPSCKASECRQPWATP